MPIYLGMRLRGLAVALLGLCAVAAPAGAAPYLPPPGHVFAGVTGGSSPADYEQAVGRHAPVFQFFSSWNAPADWMFQAAGRAHARLMIHISTAVNGREVITPKGIADTRGCGC